MFHTIHTDRASEKITSWAQYLFASAATSAKKLMQFRSSCGVSAAWFARSTRRGHLIKSQHGRHYISVAAASNAKNMMQFRSSQGLPVPAKEKIIATRIILAWCTWHRRGSQANCIAKVTSQRIVPKLIPTHEQRPIKQEKIIATFSPSSFH